MSIKKKNLGKGVDGWGKVVSGKGNGIQGCGCNFVRRKCKVFTKKKRIYKNKLFTMSEISKVVKLKLNECNFRFNIKAITKMALNFNLIYIKVNDFVKIMLRKISLLEEKLGYTGLLVTIAQEEQFLLEEN